MRHSKNFIRFLENIFSLKRNNKYRYLYTFVSLELSNKTMFFCQHSTFKQI
jgi:hypothetical protein